MLGLFVLDKLARPAISIHLKSFRETFTGCCIKYKYCIVMMKCILKIIDMIPMNSFATHASWIKLDYKDLFTGISKSSVKTKWVIKDRIHGFSKPLCAVKILTA